MQHFIGKVSNLPTFKKVFLGTQFLGSSENLDSDWKRYSKSYKYDVTCKAKKERCLNFTDRFPKVFRFFRSHINAQHAYTPRLWPRHHNLGQTLLHKQRCTNTNGGPHVRKNHALTRAVRKKEHRRATSPQTG